MLSKPMQHHFIRAAGISRSESADLVGDTIGRVFSPIRENAKVAHLLLQIIRLQVGRLQVEIRANTSFLPAIAHLQVENDWALHADQRRNPQPVFFAAIGSEKTQPGKKFMPQRFSSLRPRRFDGSPAGRSYFPQRFCLS
jgi:hypothetical protein